jgi:hypothetical protein
MTKLEAITTLLGKKESEALIFFVKKARKCGSQHLAWKDKGQKLLTMTDCDVEFDRQEFLRRHASLEALASLKFMSFRKTGDKRIEENYHLTLYPAAIQRVEYEERSPLGKKWEVWKLRDQERRVATAFIMSVLAFCFSAIALFIKIVEFVATLQTP